MTKTIRKTTIRKTAAALAFIALAAGATSALAQQGPRGDGHRAGLDFDRADADESGDVSFDEFAAAMNRRVGGADANGDGKMTVAEIADELQRLRAERQARRIVERFDANGDGELTVEEIRSRQQKMFALLDRNDDGKIVRDELPRRAMKRDGQRRWRQ